MASEINWKNIMVCSVAVTLVMVLIEFFLQPTSYVKLDFLKNFSKEMTNSQYIAPQRLFVNCWRVVRNSYVDETLNNQDWTYWRKKYFKQIKTMDDANVAINSMLASLNDPYSKFLLSNSFARQKMVIDSKISGVGVLFDKTGDDIVINHVFANTSAATENIQTGDTIVGVNGEETKNISMEKLVEELNSGDEEKVEITIKRDNVLITKELTKKDVFVSTMSYEITDDNIGIIKLSSVTGEKAISEFMNILFKIDSTKGVILDLRNNYGGTIVNAILMANLMMNDKEIIRIKSRINREYEIYTESEKIFKEKPIVILVNGKTASAAEIFAGTLQTNLGAIVIGENTFGKNAIQQVLPMHNRTGLIITTDKYILPDGRDIHKVGLTPDIVLKNEKDKDIQLAEAKKLISEVVKNKK